MGKIKKLISPRSSPQKGQTEPAEGTLPHSGEAPTNSPEKPTKKLRKLRDDSSPRNRSSVSSFASSSSYVLVSSRETFICETRPLEVPPNVIQAPVSVEITPTQPIRKAPLGPRKRSLPRPPAARAPIQTRSRTAAALHSDLPLPSEETTDVFINPHFEEPSSPIVPVTVEGSSSSREPDSEECLAGFPEPKQRSNDQMVIYVDSFPGVKNIKNPWNIFDSYTVPPSAFATPQPAAPKPAPRVDSPPKKRRLSSRKAHRRAEWFTDPSRPKLDTIPEAPSLEVENEDESRLSSPLNFTFLVNTSQQSFFEIENPPSEVELSQNSKGIDSDELTTSEEDPKDQAPSGWPANGPKEERSSPKPNPKMILSSLFNMLEQDSI
ncbi:hypothetical protein Pst134EB_003916 [Puccinia striiformis f. sp. tritici]|uniref:Uncharacterized protein n=1 Tax=Puccinia striiformis f. sp. tritici PST-78 TaxID=1165861 RepID=A0A0L0VV28_9BASI|nr:hypothetical protein Pst134EB_003916 [Puccinia striiformis f. sp. tritici]KNF02865.1 hypothetical protein PSTG_03814 [Puccinia striiformis f. sp. tritici PST-78]